MNEWKRGVVRVWHKLPSKGGQFQGTAFFLSPQHLLTCTHVIEDPIRKGIIDAQEIFLQGSAWDGGYCAIRDVKTDDRWDIALIRLNVPIPTAYTFFFSDSTSLDDGETIRLAGFSDPEQALESRDLPVSKYDYIYNHHILHTSIAHGMSGGPALRGIALVGVTRLRSQDQNLTYVVPLTSFLGFLHKHGLYGLSQFVTQPVGMAEIQELMVILRDVQIEDAFANDCLLQAAPGSYRPESRPNEDTLRYAICFLAKKEHNQRSAPILLFLEYIHPEIEKQLTDEALKHLDSWKQRIAEQVEFDLDSIRMPIVRAGTRKDSKTCTVTIKVEPKNLVSKDHFDVTAWSFGKDGFLPQCVSELNFRIQEEGFSRDDLELALPQLIGQSLRSLGLSAKDAIVELILPLCMFDWPISRQLRIGTGPEETQCLGCIYPLVLRSWDRIYNHAEFDAVRHQWGSKWDEHPKKLGLQHLDYLSDPNVKPELKELAYAIFALFNLSGKGIETIHRKAFGTALAVGIPFMFWRLGLSSNDAKFLSEVQSEVVAHDCVEWPARLKALRESQGVFWHDIQLLWDRADHLPPDTDYTLVMYE